MGKDEYNTSVVSSAGKKILLMLVLLLMVVLTGTLIVRESVDIGRRAAIRPIRSIISPTSCSRLTNPTNFSPNNIVITQEMVNKCAAACPGAYLYANRYTCSGINLPGGCQDNGQRIGDNYGAGDVIELGTPLCGSVQVDVGCKNSSGTWGSVAFSSASDDTVCAGLSPTPQRPPEITPTPTRPSIPLTCESWKNVWIRTATGDCNSYDLYSRDDERCKTTTGNINVINNVRNVNPTTAYITEVKYGNLIYSSPCSIYETSLRSVWDSKPWEPYTTNKPFDFGAGTGERKVCAQFRSTRGATTPVCGAMVKLEAPSPTPTRRVTPTPTKRVTPTPTRRVTPTPTKRVTPTPTSKVTIPPTSPPISCTNFGIDEHSGSHSNLVEIGLDPKSLVANIILRRRLDCKTGDRICDGEGMDNYPGTNNVYFIMNSVEGGKPTIFRVTNRETGSYTKVRELSSKTKFYALSFHPKNKNLYGWSKGGGLYIINLSNGNISRQLSSKLDITGMTWSLDGLYLYGIAGGRIYRFSYNPSSGAINPAGTVGSLSGDIDAMDMTSDGKLVVLYRKSGSVYMNFLSVSPSRARLTRRYRISSFTNLSKAELSNIDGFAWLCGRAP